MAEKAEVEAFAGKDPFMERGPGREGDRTSDLAVIAREFGLTVDRAEQLAEIVAGQIGVDDLDRPAGNRAPGKGRALPPHLQRRAAVRAAEIGDAQRGFQSSRLHTVDRPGDQGGRASIRRAPRCRTGIVAGALHRHETGVPMGGDVGAAAAAAGP